MKIGLIGNPNVGKSTIFNALTGLRQHTGNWPGKTVEKAVGYKVFNNIKYEFEDLPGTYSLMAHSKEEEVTRDFVYFGDYDALVIVVDAVCLERNLNLVLGILEITNKVVICVNMIDEAKKKGIYIDFKGLKDILKVPVIPVCARKKQGIEDILVSLSKIKNESVYKVKYDDFIWNEALDFSHLLTGFNIDEKVLALKLLSGELELFKEDKIIQNKINEARCRLYKKGIKKDDIKEIISEQLNYNCEMICQKTVVFTKENYQKKDLIIDKIVTGRITGRFFMICLLLLVFWITIKGANLPSEILYDFFFGIENEIVSFLNMINFPGFVTDCLVFGVYRVLAWVVSVMLPPMAIFFPLFTLLEDLGYLPRVAFNLDKTFKKCASCGKQALTMMMNFGCNAVGVIGARIIDSKRERLISILTSSFIPCNGRFPILITIITIFFVFAGDSSLAKAFFLTLFILFGIIMTFIVSKILSLTLLKGKSMPFTLELPPYRKPQITKVIVRSILDKTIFVLRRAILISAPAGLVIWLMANINVGDVSVLKMCSSALDPFGRSIGLDGMILMAFILGFPANEIVIPIMIMGYMSLGHITDFNNINELKNLFIQNGWNLCTAICMCVFTLIHFPCLTTVFTIKKEIGSLKWTLLSIIIPFLTGVILCFVITFIYNLVI